MVNIEPKVVRKSFKLVRDKIPGIIQKDGRYCATHKASEAEYKQKLIEKLKEEADELLKAKYTTFDEELSDIQEVIDALCELSYLSKNGLTKLQKQKKLKYGAFKKRLIIDEFEPKEP